MKVEKKMLHFKERKKDDLEKDDMDNNNNNNEAKDTWYTHEK